MLMLVTLRGDWGEFNPWQIAMGQSTGKVLEHAGCVVQRVDSKNGTIRDQSPVPLPFKLGVPSLGGPMTTAGGVAFMSSTLDDYVRAYDVTSGRQLWQARLPGNYSASPVFAHGRVLFLNETGVATWVKASKTFERLGTNELPGSTLATPAFLDGAMYLRTDTTLYKFAN